MWYRSYTFISYGPIIAKLLINEVIRQYIPSNRRSRYRLLRAHRVNLTSGFAIKRKIEKREENDDPGEEREKED